MSSFDELMRTPGEDGPAPLPPRPDFSPGDIRGHLAEARQLRTIGTGQPIKASWLCLEALEIYRRHDLPADLDFVEALEVLVLCYTDDIKRGSLAYVTAAAEALKELGQLGGIPHATAIHSRRRRESSFSPREALSVFRALAPESRQSSEDFLIRSTGMKWPLVQIPRGALPLRADEHGTVDCAAVPGARILLEEPVRLKARFERLYLDGIVGMSQALRIERSSQGRPNPVQIESEMAFLVDAAWWFDLATLVAREVPNEPEEAYRKARAKSSMLIRRLDAGKHFQMATLEVLDLLE